jgi:RecB family exonuclease
MKFRLKHIEGLEPLDTPESLRMGTGWHKLHELFSAAKANSSYDGLAVITEYLNNKYSKSSLTVSPADMAIEQQKLLVSFLAYQVYWANDPFEVLETELPFEFTTGDDKHSFTFRGRIDQLVKWYGRVYVLERKTTSSNITNNEYWSELANSIQVQMYALAAKKGSFDYLPEGSGLNVLYDVWSKPTIRPKLVGPRADNVRETPEQYGARLQTDINENSETYFARREIPQLADDLDKFEQEIVNMARVIKGVNANNCWYGIKSRCREYGNCPFLPVCFGNDKTGFRKRF